MATGQGQREPVWAQLNAFVALRQQQSAIKAQLDALKEQLIPWVDAQPHHRAQADNAVVEVRQMTLKRLNHAEVTRLVRAGATTESALYAKTTAKVLYVVAADNIRLEGNRFVFGPKKGGGGAA